MLRAYREGYCKVWVREGGGAYLLTRDHYQPLRAAWMRGEAFYTGTDHFGVPCTIKLATVEGVCDFSPAAIAEMMAEEAAERAERAIRGDG